MAASPTISWRRLWPLLILAAGTVLFLALGGGNWLSLETLRARHADLTAFVDTHYVQAALLYLLIYMVTVALSVPGGTPLTLVGGFLFGVFAATCYILVAATAGAVIVFLIARSSLGEPLRRRAGPWFSKLAAGFERDMWSYMLILRLVPLVPFFVVNLVPAFLGVSLTCFAVTTFFGILPAVVVYASLGSGLGTALASGGDLAVAVSPQIILGLIGLALLAGLPILYRRRKGRGVSHD
jgi:uncharacterized membrane protein YdjX (TVP38/TMEM64 family)